MKQEKEILFIADNFRNLSRILKSKKNLTIDTEQTRNFALSGYTFGENTIFKEVNKTFPGYLYLYKENKLEQINYYNWKPYKKRLMNFSESKDKLKKLNIKIINKLIASSNNRCIAVPLSAGYDSRFILSGLVEKGYKNIFCFSYGKIGNREATVAKNIAKKLNIPWTFIEYTPKRIKKFLLSKEYKLFKKFSDLTVSVHSPQDFFAINFLKKNNIIPSNSIIVNGQTGDFISGNHIFYNSKNDNYDDLINLFYHKHYKISKRLMFLKSKSVKQSIKNRISTFNLNRKNTDNIREALQKIEYEDRQAKYLMGDQRTYEYFGYDWRLPLWDKEYVKFFEKLNIEYKVNQLLYKEVLIEQNWGDVWKNFPVNPKNTFSFKMEFMRFFFKCIFVLLGKKKWHRFELKFLDYFMNPLCGYAAWNYFSVVFNNREYSSPLGWHIEEYLNQKGLDWRGEYL